MILGGLGDTSGGRNPDQVVMGPNQYLMCFNEAGTPDHLAIDIDVLSDISAGGTTTLLLANSSIETHAQVLAAVRGEPAR